jgi:drug/metabolite transporter (DMT)-like permease
MLPGFLKQGSPLLTGSLLALASACSFGASVPLLHRVGQGVGPFWTASLLYAGAALGAAAWPRKHGAEARVSSRQLPRLLLVALAGAVVAPAALAWGLQRADTTSASLLLNFEAVFTVGLAWALYREAVSRRVGGALLLMLAAGAVLVLSGARGAVNAGPGLGAVLLATFGWAVDNALTRPLADFDPVGIVARKGLLGALCTAALAVLFRERLAEGKTVAALLACGATGFGLSLRLYLLAQRKMGAARTASVFAVAPFVGAALAWAMGEGQASPMTGIAGLLFGAGVYLHLSESHAHVHTHEPVVHEHAHRHDDHHHEHSHDPPVVGVHSHVHTHGAVTHEHEHAPDVHHGHRH